MALPAPPEKVAALLFEASDPVSLEAPPVSLR